MYFGLLVLAVGCGRSDATPSPFNNARSVAPRTVVASCGALPDSAAEALNAVVERNDIPDTRISLKSECPVATVALDAAARIQRTYRVRVDSGQTLIARIRGFDAPFALAFDVPARVRPDSSNLGRVVVDSIRVNVTRDVLVRVTLTPKIKEDPRVSAAYLTVLARP